jgi:hypothetical protein
MSFALRFILRVLAEKNSSFFFLSTIFFFQHFFVQKTFLSFQIALSKFESFSKEIELCISPLLRTGITKIMKFGENNSIDYRDSVSEFICRISMLSKQINLSVLNEIGNALIEETGSLRKKINFSMFQKVENIFFLFSIAEFIIKRPNQTNILSLTLPKIMGASSKTTHPRK